MKRFFILPALSAVLATPVIASPAEDFGEKMKTESSSPASLNKAVDVLSGDSVGEVITLGQNEVVTRSRGMTAGIQQLAQAMNVDPNDYTMAELAKMYIGEYD